MSAVLWRRDGATAVVTLNRPERLNAIDEALVVGLADALRRAHDDAEVRAIVLVGAGRAFCSGDDLADFPRQSQSSKVALAHVTAIQDVSRLILKGPKPVIAAVRGFAVGGGLEWMIDADLAILAEGTQCFFPETNLGLYPTGGITALLPRLVGLAKARELLLFGERFDAAAALALGLAWKVVSDDALLPEAMAVAARIALLPAEAVTALRRGLLAGLEGTLDAALTAETAATLAAFVNPATAARVAGVIRRADR